MSNGPVVVSLHVEGFGGQEDETYEIDRAEWDAMTPAEREADIARAAEDFATNIVNWGWHIEDPEDYAAATEGSADAGEPADVFLRSGIASAVAFAERRLADENASRQATVEMLVERLRSLLDATK